MQQERVKPTLKRTKYACVNCKAAKAACDSNRPCAWCIRHALQDTCVDAPRKTRTSKKICCDPSLHKNVVFKQEYKGFQLALASDFSPSSALPLDPPLSPPNDIFPIEDFLAPGGFDFGLNTAHNQPCTNCPLYQTCAKDAPQRLICATSGSPPQSPLTPEAQDDDDTPSPPPPPTPSSNFPVMLGAHPDFCLALPPPPSFKAPSPSLSLPLPASLDCTPPLSHTPLNRTPQPTPEPASPSTFLTQPSPHTSSNPPTPQQQQQKSPYCTPPSPAPAPSTPLTAPCTPQTQIVQASPASARGGGGCCSSSSSTSSSHLPPLLDDMCNCQSLVQREMAKINASLDTISALMQLQNSSLLPTATFQLPDTTIEDCNDEFAKALGYEGKEDLMSSATVDSITSSTKEMMRISSSDPASPSPTKSKLALVSLVPEKNAASVQRYSSDLMKASTPTVNQIVFSTKKGDAKFFTVLIKPCGWFSYITILKQHPQAVEGLGMCGE